MKRILVIEDERFVREQIVELLQLEGFETISAENGLTGIEKARMFYPNLIISDVMMPKMDGFEVLRTLRMYPETAEIPFIFLTARATHADMRKGMTIGADDYLTKPFTMDELLSAVKTRLQRHQDIWGRVQQLRTNISLSLPHEFRTPLTNILGFSQLIVDFGGTFDQAQIKEIGSTLIQNGKRLQHLIENYLLYGKIELASIDAASSDWPPEKEIIYEPGLLNTPIQELAERYNRFNDLSLHLSTNKAHLRIGEEHFVKILTELTDNAFKFSKSGTPVSVSVENKGTDLVMTVSDNGRGMDPKQVEAIGGYMQFGRSIYEQPGSGLGLIIAKKLTEIYSGRFELNSELTSGTRIVVCLPIITDAVD